MSEEEPIGLGCTPMVSFLRAHPQECDECVIAPIVVWYKDLVKDRPDLLAKLEGLDPDTVTAEQMATVLDEVKAQVEPAIQAQMQELNCAVQEAVLQTQASEGR